MRLARVTGTVVATQKHEKLLGAKLLLVQPLDGGGAANGEPLLAVDAAQAGVGAHVLVVQEGRAAVAAIRRPAAPADTAIVGIVDRVDRLDGGEGPAGGVAPAGGVRPFGAAKAARADSAPAGRTP